MADRKISELESTTDLQDLYTIGTDKNNNSKKVKLQFVKEAADYANAQGDYAKEVADNTAGNTGVNDYPIFSASGNYVAGDVVNYNGRLYRFTAPHQSGSWNGNDVETTSINAESQRKLTELSVEVINEVNRKGFLIDASIEGWTREDYNLYIDYIYRNDPNYGSGIRVIDEQGATIVYMIFQGTKKKGIDKVSQDTEYGKVTLVVNWDVLNDGYNAILENRIAVPNTAFLNTTSDLFAQYEALSAQYEALSAECDDLSTRLNVGCEGVLINITDKYYIPIQLSAPLKAGMIVESIADATGVYFRNKQGGETYYGADSFPLSLKEDIYEVVPTSNATGNIVVKSYVDSKMVALDDRIATINSELDKTINEVNRKGFLIDASIEGWTREDYNLYIDYIYRNDPDYGSGIRVIDANGSNVAYMNFSEYKKGIDEVSQDTEYGKITLVVNWDYFNDGYNALLQNKIIIPNTAFISITPALQQVAEYLGAYDYPSFQENYKYITGEIVVYNDMLYRFVKVHEGVWDYNDVTPITFNTLLTDGVNRKGFLIDASIEGWTREDYNLYIDYIYRNDPNYGSGIRVIDEQGATIVYMIFQGTKKKGIDKVSQDTEYGKITLVVNWDVLNDGDNGWGLQNKIIIPNTAFKKSDSSKEESVKVHLPSTIYAVVGDTLQVFYRGCVQAVNPYNYNILVTCDKGKQFPRYWEYIPTSSDIGTATLKISVRDNSLNVLASTTCKVVTIAKGTNPSSIMNVACFGDSLTAGGEWCAEAARRLTGEGGQPSGDNLNNIAFVGKKKKDGYGYYGEGGWTWKSYTTKDAVIAYRFYVKDVSSLSLYATYSLGGVTYTINEINVTSGVGNILCVPNGNATPPSSGTMTKVTGNGDLTIAYTNVQQVAMNPLWDESNNKMSFVPYANDYCNGEIDLVYTLLTWNNLWTNKESFSDIIDDVKTFADTLHREFPSAKLKIMGIQIPSVTGGMGANYGSSGEGYADQYGMAITAFKLNSAYKDFAAQDTYKDFVEYIDIASQFDTEYNMPFEMTKVNVRSSQTEMRGTNGVHPSMEGYMQIADVVYRSICSEL